MPNHFQNNLTISGEKIHMDEFLKALSITDACELEKLLDESYLNSKWTHGFIDHLIPMPPALRDCEATHPPNQLLEMANLIEFGYNNWLDWTSDMWGTKWGDYATRLTDYDLDGVSYPYIQLVFESAWGPPHNAFMHLSLQYDNLIFTHSGFDECQEIEDSITTVYKNGQMS